MSEVFYVSSENILCATFCGLLSVALHQHQAITNITKHSEGISEGLLVENNKEYRINIDGKKFRIE